MHDSASLFEIRLIFYFPLMVQGKFQNCVKSSVPPIGFDFSNWKIVKQVIVVFNIMHETSSINPLLINLDCILIEHNESLDKNNVFQLSLALFTVKRKKVDSKNVDVNMVCIVDVLIAL